LAYGGTNKETEGNEEFEEMIVEHESNPELNKKRGRPPTDLADASHRTLQRKFKPLDDFVEQFKTSEGNYIFNYHNIELNYFN
jgi:hypothetical protein